MRSQFCFLTTLSYLILNFRNEEVKEVKTYVLLLKNYAKKTIVLTPQRP